MGVYRGGKDTTESYRALDVRWLHRRGFLCSGYSSSITWSRGGEQVASIRIIGDSCQVTLEYSCQKYGQDSKHLCYPVSIDWTRCNYGGSRPWFLCPVRGCGRRVAVLYGGEVFACRHCHGIVYESQHEPAHYRALRKLQKIREKLGGSGNMAEDFPGKPKGMQWRTYRRLCHEYENSEARSCPPFLLKMLMRR